MNITWFNDETKDIVATLTPRNITVNKVGAQFFESANQVMLGYDLNKNVIIIKPLSKEDVMRGDIQEHTMYNVSINVSYARISNKSFLKKMDELFSLNLTEKGNKYKATWRSNLSVLEVSVKEVL